MTRRSITPLVVLVTVTVLALTTGFDALFRMSYVLGLALVGGLMWAWAGLRGIDARIVQPNCRGQVGKLLDNRVLVLNRSKFSRHGIDVQQVSDLPGHRLRIFADIPGKAKKEGRWVDGQVILRSAARCTRRGFFRLGPFKITASDPLGFFKISRSSGRRREIIVHPAIEDIPYFQVPLVDFRGERNIRNHSNLMALQACSVREYAQGDSLNRIHWPSTARQGKLMVKEFDIGRSSRVWLVVDMERRVQAGHGADTTDELSASIAASVANRVLMMDMPVGLISYGPTRCLVPAQRGAKHLELLLDSLALLKPEGSVSLSQVLMEEERLAGKDDTIIVVSPSLETDWVKLLDGMTKRHAPTCVISIDPKGFKDRADNSHLIAELSRRQVRSFLVGKGEPLANALSSSMVGAVARTATAKRSAVS